jgi:hypothetical protein
MFDFALVSDGVLTSAWVVPTYFARDVSDWEDSSPRHIARDKTRAMYGDGLSCRQRKLSGYEPHTLSPHPGPDYIHPQGS